MDAKLEIASSQNHETICPETVFASRIYLIGQKSTLFLGVTIVPPSASAHERERWQSMGAIS